MEERTSPVWKEGERIIAPLYCQQLAQELDLRCINGTFFNLNGPMEDEDWLKKRIYDDIKPYCTGKPDQTVKSLLNTLRMEAYAPGIPLEEDVIHFHNGTLFLENIWMFDPEKIPTRHRLPIDYDPNAPRPSRWEAFVRELLEEEDIPTLQEYMGYCLIPSTRGQRMLLITGRGGEGKSRIKAVMGFLLGKNMWSGHIDKLEHSRFAVANLEHKLLMVDDELKMEALPQTNNIKALVTAEQKTEIERKGVQSYQTQLYCRLMAFGNGKLRAQNDHSIGFYRRQIILQAKQKAAGREDDVYLAEKFYAERQGILCWCLEGLDRLRRNNFHFTISQKAKHTMLETMKEQNSVGEFLHSEGYVVYGLDLESPTTRLYGVYCRFCEDNAIMPLGKQAFSETLRDEQESYGIRYSRSLRIGGKQVRGYRGIGTLNL